MENSSMFTDVYRGLVFIEVVTVSLKKKKNNWIGQIFNGTPRVEFFISLDFAELTTHVIQAHFYIR